MITIVFFLSAAVLGYTLSYMLLYSANRKKLLVEERLAELTSDSKEKEKYKKKAQGPKKEVNFKVSDEFRKDLELSGLQMKTEEFMLMWIFVALFPAALVFVVTQNVVQAAVVMLIGAVGPMFFVKKKIGDQRKLFEVQLGDALLIIANGLRAGFSFPQALQNVANNMADPVKREFRNAAREMSVGVDIETSLTAVADRMDNQDLRLLITAVVIQQQVGGNLSEILETISQTIRDRMKIKRSVKTLTAQGRMSGYLIGALPVFLLVAVGFMNPTYMAPLFSSTLGNIILAVGAIMEAIGFLVIKKIVDIKF